VWVNNLTVFQLNRLIFLNFELLGGQGIGVYFLIPENHQEIQEFNHNEQEGHKGEEYDKKVVF
jgi:hypothetical protein